MPPAPRRDPNVAERKIYFHKIVDDDDPDFVLDRARLVERIDGLTGTADFYIDEGDEQFLSAVVDRAEAPQHLRLYRIRRRNLPEIEAEGIFGDLNLAEREGLAESIHIVLFDENVIGSEYNHYGPRTTTFGQYLAERCDMDVRIRQFIRKDVIAAILNMREIRTFRAKVTPQGAAALQQAGVALSDGFEAADVFRSGKYVDMTWASEPADQQFTERVKRFVRSIRDADRQPEELLEAAHAYGRTSDDLLDTLDLFRDRVVITKEIRRESPRHRTLDTQAAFSAIEAVYAELADDLAEGGTLTVEA
jgi:hypothetical protein